MICRLGKAATLSITRELNHELTSSLALNSRLKNEMICLKMYLGRQRRGDWAI